jgi:hypothetical protein
MQTLPQLPSSASGALGGIVATHGRAGAQFRALHIPTNPRSRSQQANRAAVGSLAAAWRTISANEKASWDCAAARTNPGSLRGRPFTPSPYTLFCSCNRNLQSISVTPLLRTCPPPPPIPPVNLFGATPLYALAGAVPALVGFLLTIDPTLPATTIVLIRASAALSPARGNIRPSNLKIIQPWTPAPSYTTVITNTWTAVYGTAPSAGLVTFTATLVDPATGYAGPPARATLSYSFTPPPPTPPGTLLIEFNGIPAALLSGQVIYINGQPVASA